MRLQDLFETLHRYDNVDNANFAPLKKGDQIRVFHGFRNLEDAVNTAQYGLSGALRANRTYSYEFDNNPKGLFVTINFRKASEFVGSHGAGAILEFMADVSDLEAPVWPSGSYTVQGQYAQYFGRGIEGRRNRKNARNDAEALAKNNEQDFIKDSDNPHLAQMLMASYENQALFVGNLNPNNISTFYIRKEYNSDWKKISPKDLVERYKSDKYNPLSVKVFEPNEEFDGDKLFTELSKQFGEESVISAFKSFWEDIQSSSSKTQTFQNYFDMYLWPKQYVPALKWLRAFVKSHS